MMDPKRPLPLAVDLDGTLVRGDRLHDAAAEVFTRAPWLILPAILAWMRGRAAMKRFLAKRARAFDPETLPYHAEVLERIEEEIASGREVILVTGTDHEIAKRIAEHLGFHDYFGSDGTINLTGHEKARYLISRYGEGGYEYWGDSTKDLPAWEKSGAIGIVGPKELPEKWKLPAAKIRTHFIPEDPGTLRELLRGMRPLQWMKNLLVLLPLFFGQRYGDPEAWIHVTTAFAALCACASAVYLLNDWMDMGSDRAHPRKSGRPLARGTLSPLLAIAAAFVLFACAFSLPITLGLPTLVPYLILYAVVALLYSTTLKTLVGIDVLILAAFYTFRVFLGAEAVGVVVSEWLFTFSLFFFLSLALLKRYAELAIVEAPSRRGYQSSDRGLLATFGAASAIGSVLVLALYIQHPTVRSFYSKPERLWFALPLALYGILRTWFLASHGRTGDDPVSFALRDPLSYVLTALAAVLVLWAT